jgi:hypothetical protein
MGVTTAGISRISRLQIARALGFIDARVKTRRENSRQGGYAGETGDLSRLPQKIAPADIGRFRKTNHFEDFRFLFRIPFNGLDMIVRSLL